MDTTLDDLDAEKSGADLVTGLRDWTPLIPISFVRIDQNFICMYVQDIDLPIRRNDEHDNYGTDTGTAPEKE